MLIPDAQIVEGTSRVAILAATTRQRSSSDTGQMFNGLRSDDVSYAAITVSIPPDSSRKIGDIPWPVAPPGDPHHDFVTVSANYLEQPSFNTALTAQLKQIGSGKVLVFVHGFNNKFDDAVYRFAQIVHDSKAPVVPVLFSWPSRGEIRLAAYTYDRESANYSRQALAQLLDTLALNPNVKEITVLAHSMGNWVALEALRAKASRTGKISGKIKNVLLVAPDVDADVFRTEIRAMGTDRPRIALFVSQDDQALKLSRSIWGDMPRIGDVDPEQEPYRSEFERENIMVFDLSHLKGDAHSRAFTDVTSVMGMIQARLADGQKMNDRTPDLADAGK
jgi:esterase/lipase superfamily enzyme